jgi:hypothetical protein
LDPKNQIPKLSMMAMRSTSDDDYYFISMEILHTRIQRTKQVSISIDVQPMCHVLMYHLLYNDLNFVLLINYSKGSFFVYGKEPALLILSRVCCR